MMAKEQMRCINNGIESRVPFLDSNHLLIYI